MAHRHLSYLILAASVAAVCSAVPLHDRIAEFKTSCAKPTWKKDRCAQAREALQELGASAVPALEGFLTDPDFMLAAEAASALGNMASAAAPAVPGLIQALGHDHGLVTGAADAALVKLAPHVPSVVPALTRVIEAIPQNKSNIKEIVRALSALSALGDIGPPAESAIPTLLAVFKTMMANPYNYAGLPGIAATALEKIGAGKNPSLAREQTYPMAPTIQEALTRYEEAYQSVSGSNAPSPDALVRLFNLSDTLQEAFTHTWWEGTDKEFRKIEARAPGMRISSGETIRMSKDIPFFKNLADRTRDSDAVRFFTLLSATYPDSRRFWEDPVSDFGSCTKFGDGKFVDFHGRWSDFKPAHASIQELVRTEKAEIIDAMKEDCVCPANADPIIKDYELFLATYPNDPASNSLRKRLSEIKAGTAKIKFKCYPG